MTGNAAIIIQGDGFGKGLARIRRTRETNIACILLRKRLYPGQKHSAITRNSDFGTIFPVSRYIFRLRCDNDRIGKAFPLVVRPGNQQPLILHFC